MCIICFMLADMISFSEIAGVRLELEDVLETMQLHLFLQ